MKLRYLVVNYWMRYEIYSLYFQFSSNSIMLNRYWKYHDCLHGLLISPFTMKYKYTGICVNDGLLLVFSLLFLTSVL